jgi:tetratricopeptide (TPR) repeat protein
MQSLALRSAALCAVIVGLLILSAAADRGVSGATEAIMAGAYRRATVLLDPQVQKDPQDLEVRGLLAIALYLNGQRFQAERHALVLHRLDPEGRQTAYLVSRHFLAAFRQDSPVAASLVDLLGRSGPDGFLWLGQTYQERKLYTDAVTILSRGVSRFPDSARLLDGLGFNEWKAGLRESAVMAYLRAIYLAPRSWGLYYNLGWVYYSGGMYTNAATAWKAALGLAPSNPMLPALIQDAEQRVHS